VGSVEIILQLKGPLKKYGLGEENFTYQLPTSQLSLLEIADQLKMPASSVSFVTVNDLKSELQTKVTGGEVIVFYPRVAGG
jgi:molybdopterin converting factor small subunit